MQLGLPSFSLIKQDTYLFKQFHVVSYNPLMVSKNTLDFVDVLGIYHSVEMFYYSWSVEVELLSYMYTTILRTNLLPKYWSDF